VSAAALRPVRVGVAGLGAFGLLHARTLAGLAEAELVAVVDARPERLNEVARLLPGVRQWASLERALAESDAEAWVVASSTAAHVPMARAVLGAGKLALVEKPIAYTLPEAESLASLVRPDSANLMMGHVALFNSEFVQLRAECRGRGPIRFVNGVRHRPVTTMGRMPGEHPLHLLMVHDLYMTQSLMHAAEPTGFDCRLHRAGGRDDGAVDLATATLVWPGGAIASLTASFMTPAGMPADGFDRMEVFGDGWAARIDPNPRPIRVWDDDRARWPVGLEVRAGDAAAPAGMLAEELRCFCRVARGAEPVPVGARYQDALQVHRWIDRLEAAARGA
jgi:predicted dehydrogenase